MKNLFFLSLLSLALYSCSNDDFDVTNKGLITNSSIKPIEKNNDLSSESSLINILTDSLGLDEVTSSAFSVKIEYIKKTYRFTYKYIKSCKIFL